MLAKIRSDQFFENTLLELICYVPLMIIAGNVLPAIGPLKIHWIYIGAIFINVFLLFIKNKRSHGFLLLALCFAIIQLFTAKVFYLKDFIDFMSGPMLFILVVNIVCFSSISLETLRLYRNKFLICAAAPIGLAVLQLIKVVPLEILNATYVNITIFGTEKVLRVNGFLFHGIELAVIIFFFFVNIALFRKTSNVYILFVVMVALEFMTKIKSGIMTSILYLGFFTYLIDEKYRFIKASVFAAVIILSISFIYILIPDIETNRLNFDFRHFKFEGQLFTGRGFIWNVYITSLKTIDTWQVLFGCGYGSAPDMFRQGATNTMAAVSKIAPGPHNQLLELFVNGGLFAMWFIFYILKKQYSKLKKLFNNKVVLKYYLAVILIPIVIMGLTAPIMSMFIYWCGLSMFVISLKLKFSEENA